MELERFGELERRIRELVEGHSALRHRNQELERLLEERSARLEEAEGKAQALIEQKDAVRAKVDTLLDMLRDVEMS
ncbi:MAG: cell division protein ZapB [Deltaproteobacteria bacterium]|nr:cell division protein ZapB [Deltaproteobacteria bacterium]